MFENIAELEKEVQEFRKNILASSELVASLERMIAQAKEQTRVTEAASNNLSAHIDQQTQALKKSFEHEQAAQAKLISEQTNSIRVATETVTKELEKQTTDIQRRIEESIATNEQQSKKQVEAFDAASATLRTTVSNQTDSMATVVREMIAQMEQQASKLSQKISELSIEHTRRFSTQEQLFDNAVAGLEQKLNSSLEVEITRLIKTNQELIDRALNLIDSANQNYELRSKAAENNYLQAQAALNDKFSHVIEKLEAANLDETLKLCKSISKSINVKFGILLSGVGIAIIFAVLSFLK